MKPVHSGSENQNDIPIVSLSHHHSFPGIKNFLSMLSITVEASFGANSIMLSDESERSAIARLIDSPGPHASSKSDSMKFYLVLGTGGSGWHGLAYMTTHQRPSPATCVLGRRRYSGRARRLGHLTRPNPQHEDWSCHRLTLGNTPNTSQPPHGGIDFGPPGQLGGFNF